jgi:hypothetical protein
MKIIPLAAISVLLLAGCANGSGPEPTNPDERVNEIWLRNRELYYRNAGWNGPDAMFQSEQDLGAGKSIPADRPPMERRARG